MRRWLAFLSIFLVAAILPYGVSFSQTVTGKQITQYPLRSPVQSTDNVLLQEGGINTPYAYAPVSGLATAISNFPNGLTINGLTISNITGSVQCLQANSAGVISGTGGACGSGGGGGGGVSGPASSTIGFLPVWNNTAGTLLAAGLPVGTTGNSTVVETNSSGLIANSLISALPNSSLANSSITIASISVALGGSISLSAANLSNGTTGAGAIVLAASPTITGTLTLAGVTGSSAQCLQVSSTGAVSGTGTACGSGSGGGGNITGPSSTTVGNIPLWNNTTGTLLATGLPVGTTGNSTVVETNSSGLISNSLIANLPISSGGTGASTVAGAQANLGLTGSFATVNVGAVPTFEINGSGTASRPTSTLWGAAGGGAIFGWNYTQGQGETDFVNSNNGGVGAFNFYNVATSTSANPTLIGSITGTGDASFSGGLDNTVIGAHTAAAGTFTNLSVTGSLSISATGLDTWAQSLPTTLPSTHGILWNDGGVLSIS